MRKKVFVKSFILLLGLMGVNAVSNAQTDPPKITLVSPVEKQGVTLDEAVERALNFNPEFKALRKNVDIARSEITRANTFSNPEASLNLGRGTSSEEGGDKSITGYEISVDKQMRVGSWWFNRKAAKAGFDVARDALRSAEQALIREVKSTFYSLLSLERSLKLADETIRLNDELAKVARARFERGEVSEVEANVLEIERDGSVQAKKRLETDYLRQLYLFRNLLGSSPGENLKPQGELVSEFWSFSVKDLIQSALERRPDLLAAQNRIKQAKAQQKLAWVEVFPPVTVGFVRTKEVAGEEFTGIRLGIGVPVFDQNRARIQETKAFREQTEAQLEALLIQVSREVQTAYDNLRLLKEQIDIYEQSIQPKLEKTLEVYKKAYSSGQTGIIEILINQRQYFQAKGNYLITLGEFDQGKAELEQVIGGKLDEIFKEGGAR